MATNDITKQIERSRTILFQLLKGIPQPEREKHLTRHCEDIQSAIDRALAGLDEAAPTSVRQRVRTSLASTQPVNGGASTGHANDPASPPAEHVHTPECEHLHKAVERADAATVPGAVRAVLASEAQGLLPRQIIEGVKLLRPETDDESVHGALYQMRQRGEIAREGVHKNYRYRLTGAGSLSSLGSGIVRVANDAGGETH